MADVQGCRIDEFSAQCAPMLAALPNPILSVTPEGVRELDGREALSGLWTLFSKCKESIENGRRLENISWRLWYRDMLVSAALQCDETQLNHGNLPVEDECLSEKTYRPPTPMETIQPPPSDHDSTHLPASPTLYSGSPHSITHLAASGSIPRKHQFHHDSVRRPRRPLAVGQIICEMLPNTANVPHSPGTSPSFISLSMSPSHGGGVTRIPRSERLAPLPASLGRSDLGGSHLYIPGPTFLPLLPLLPLPEPNSALGPRGAAPSQLPTPGTEQDESTPFDGPSRIYTAPASDITPNPLPSGSISRPSIPLHSQLDSKIPPPFTTNAGHLTVIGPPSPTLSDSYTRAHPHEAPTTTVNHTAQRLEVPAIETPLQPPILSQMHSEAGVEIPSPVSSDPQPVTVPILHEDTPAPTIVATTPPRLVVVNPTPGPTPHPTPPATPLSFLPGADARLRPHGQFLAPPSTRAMPQQLTPIQAPVFTKLDVSTPTTTARVLAVGGTSDLLSGQGGVTPRLRPTTQSSSLERAHAKACQQQVGMENTLTLTSVAIQSTPPTHDLASGEGVRRPQVEGPVGAPALKQVPASQNPNRLSTSSTTSTSSTAATTTTSDISSSSQLSMGSTSVNTELSCSGQDISGNGSSDELKTLKSLGLSGATILTSLPQDAGVASPISPTSPHASTSVTSVKSTKSAVSAGGGGPRAGARRSGAPGLARRASSGATSTGGRSRKAGNLSTVNRATSNSSDSRSRSRDNHERKSVAAAAGALAATMGMTTAPAAAGPSGGARRKMGGGVKAGAKGRGGLVRTVSRGGGGGGALKRTLSHEDVEEVTDEDFEAEEAAEVAAREREAEQRVKEEERVREAAVQRQRQEEAEREAQAAAMREKERQVMSKPSRAKFKFGSNSDNGSNAGTEISSRAPGSDVYGVGHGVGVGPGGGFDVKGKGRETEASLAQAAAAQERHAEELRERELMVQRTREAEAVLARAKQDRKEQTRKEAEAVARAKAHESVADPLLPQGTKRMILLTSESDYTDTDDESWTSEDAEEGGAREAPASRQQPTSARQSSHQESRHVQPTAQQHPQQQQPQPPPFQRTHSSTSGAGRTTRRELQHIQQRREAQLRVQRAAAQLQREEEEKQRQREMFAKKPTTSFQNLTELQRTTSTGLLTQLMNPDPAIFPVNHPYRRGHSSGEIQRMGMTPMTSLTSMTSAVQTQAQRTKNQPLDQPPAPQQQQQRRPPPSDQQAPEPEPAPKPANAQQQAQPPAPQQKKNPPRTRPLPRRSVTLDSHTMAPPPPPVTTTTPAADNANTSNAVPPSPVRSERRAPSVIGMALRGMRTLAFGTGKGTTAGPMESQVIAASVSTKHVAKAPAAPPTSPEVRSPGSSTGYRPKGPLPGQEMDTDSEDEAENLLQFSKSVAQDRLKQFAARRGIVAAGSTLPPQPENEDLPAWAREEPNAGAQAPPQQPAQTAAPAPAPGPIPMMHPYNLPVNAVPSTPRTTRRQMLRNEMSESLRRQLLWERQQAGVPIRRTTSTGHVGPQRNNALNGLKPLTTTPSMVQLHAKGTGNRQQSNLRQEVGASGSGALRGSGDRERRASSRQSEGDQEARRQALARNRSWTNDYHTSGW